MVNLLQRLSVAAQVASLSLAIVTLPTSAEPTRTQTFGFDDPITSPQTARPALPEGPWYQVELYIFRQPSGRSEELWPLKDPIDFSSETGHFMIDPVPMDSGSVAFQQMPMNAIESYDVGQLLIESRRYEMLYKAAWRQPFVSQSEAPTVFISAGAPQASNRRELEGTLRLHKGRYLHVDAHLVLGKYEEHFQEIVPASANGLNANAPLSGPNDSLNNGLSTGFEDGGDLVAYPEVIALEMFELKQSRRMRSGELHYLDHPKFGLLIQINRIEDNQG